MKKNRKPKVKLNGKGPVKLTILQWSNEFLTPHMTLYRALRKAGELPDSAGRYTTHQILAAIDPPEKQSKREMLALKRQQLELKLAEQRARLMSPKELDQSAKLIHGAVANTIEAWGDIDEKRRKQLLKVAAGLLQPPALARGPIQFKASSRARA